MPYSSPCQSELCPKGWWWLRWSTSYPSELCAMGLWMPKEVVVVVGDLLHSHLCIHLNSFLCRFLILLYYL